MMPNEEIGIRGLPAQIAGLQLHGTRKLPAIGDVDTVLLATPAKRARRKSMTVEAGKQVTSNGRVMLFTFGFGWMFRHKKQENT